LKNQVCGLFCDSVNISLTVKCRMVGLLDLEEDVMEENQVKLVR
jgi:hypothetical protein